MKKKKICLFIGIMLLVGLCIIAVKINLSEIVRYKVEDLMTETLGITYGQKDSKYGKAVVSPDRKQLAFCNGTEEFFVKDLSTGTITTYPTQERVFHVEYNSDGTYLVAGKNMLQIKTGEVKVLPIAVNPGELVAFSSNGEILAVVNKERKLDTMQSFVEIWNLKTGQLIQKVTKNQYLIQQMALSPDGRYLAVAGFGIDVWDTKSGKCIKTLDSKLTPWDNTLPYPDDYNAITYSPDGKYIAAVMNSLYVNKEAESEIIKNLVFNKQSNKEVRKEAIEIWNMEQGSLVKMLKLDPSEHVERLQYSPDGQYLASGKELGQEMNMIRDAVWLWDVNRGEVVKKLTQFPEDSLVELNYSADGNYVSASGHYYTKIWTIK